MLDAVGEAIKTLGIACEVVHCDPSLAVIPIAIVADIAIPR